MRICSGPGCLRAVPDNVRFCSECKPNGNGSDGIREHTPGTTDRDKYQRLYDGKRFQGFCRPRTLQKHPFCARCGCKPSVIADHIVPAGEAIRQVRESGRFPLSPDAGFFLLSNLQGLCRSCHAEKTLEDKAHVGEWPSVLEKEDKEPKKVWTF